MIDYKTINRQIEEAYDVRVPDYNLKPVLELLSAVEPCEFAWVISECFINIAEKLMMGKRQNSSRLPEMLHAMKLIFHTFSSVCYDQESFQKGVMQQVHNNEGIFSREEIEY